MLRQLICCLCLLLTPRPAPLALPLNGSPAAVHRPFDSYHDIGWEDEKARLDSFANELLAGPDLVGHILVYAGKRSCRGEARARAERAKRYVVRRRGVAAGRVMARDGGYREEVTTFLQPAPRGAAFWMYATVEPGEVEFIKRCRNGLPSKGRRG